MTESGNYYYNVMPFGLKNAGATYQRMMNKVFRNKIGDMLKVYTNDMIVKSTEELDHASHLKIGVRASSKMSNAIQSGKMHLRHTGRKVPRVLSNGTSHRGKPRQVSGILGISDAHLEKIHPNLKQHAHFPRSVRGEIRPTRISLVQTTAQGSHLRMDSRV